MDKKQLKEFVIKTLQENEKQLNESTDKWIGGAVEHEGSLRKRFGLKDDEKVTTSLITKEIEKLEKKDKDKDKPGIQGLTKSDLKLLKKLNLAKTLAKMRHKKK